MVIECLQYKTNGGDLLKFLVENKFSNVELRLLLFWAKHPRAKLSIYTIASALDTARVNLRSAIASLVEKCILIEQQNMCGLTTYYLNNDLSVQEKIEELSKLDWSQLKLLEKHLLAEAVVYQ